jgi:hypothetical protein
MLLAVAFLVPKLFPPPSAVTPPTSLLGFLLHELYLQNSVQANGRGGGGVKKTTVKKRGTLPICLYGANSLRVTIFSVRVEFDRWTYRHNRLKKTFHR